MEAADREILPLKKRALNDISGGDDGRSSPDDSHPSSPKKKRVDGYVGAYESKGAAGGCEAPVPRHRRPVEPAALDDALSSAQKYLNKGKWIATEQQASSVAPQPPPEEKKFMYDGIRSSDQFKEREAAAARDVKNQLKSDGTGSRHAGAPLPRDDAPFRAGPGLGEAVRRRLTELGATRPEFVYQKQLQMSDVNINQNRLLLSCKRETLERCPITACLSDDEWLRVENKNAGLVVTALDRDGVPHALTLKFLDSNGGYRFISGWKGFLARNGLELNARGLWTRDVDVELWAFRSRALKRQPPIDENGKPVVVIGEDGKVDREKTKKLQVANHFHPEGSLGLVVLHHEHRRLVERDDDDDDYGEGTMGPPKPVAREKGKKQRGKRDASAPAPPSPVARAGAGAAEPGETMSKVEMVDQYGESTSNAIVALIMLRDANSRRSETTSTSMADMALN
ncbi:hypothetical protein BAE44_0011286 [Dichanthelium oligosanthes]|uniref:B3 domain-containing protein n=1 Tax=Dichanthelium oligosanthes TaxID=888268 RepID=A0A1E5VRI4_9POAL|nr:hypothetical protein BAE44_0011286 [Dichanthelium oligosanthes]